MTRSRVWPGWAAGHTRLADVESLGEAFGQPLHPRVIGVLEVRVQPIASLETAVVAAVAAMAVAVAGAVIQAWIGARKRPVEALKK